MEYEYNGSNDNNVDSAVIIDNFPFSKSETSKNKVTIVIEEVQWVRDVQMTCYQVWINQDNKFEMVFFWPYKDNNWVRIYDMSGNMVYEVDMPLDNPHIIVDLPDGTFIVKTFHDQQTSIQEFAIGKT